MCTMEPFERVVTLVFSGTGTVSDEYQGAKVFGPGVKGWLHGVKLVSQPLASGAGMTAVQVNCLQASANAGARASDLKVLYSSDAAKTALSGSDGFAADIDDTLKANAGERAFEDGLTVQVFADYVGGPTAIVEVLVWGEVDVGGGGCA